MGDENHIRTLGDYSRPSHKGYRNTIDLPEGNNVVPLRSDKKHHPLVQTGCSIHLYNGKNGISLTTQFLCSFLSISDKDLQNSGNDILMFQHQHGESSYLNHYCVSRT
ncbi:hypothetical protein Tco_0716232 [Tanacetum coccineum]